jgi:uncharacterized protein (DUF427 family)
MARELPRWAELGRQAWTHVGRSRPAFAKAPGEGQESVWDYPRPPRLVGDERRVRVMAGDVLIAETTQAARVLETSQPPTFYLPPGDVNMDRLRRVGAGSRCEWKGEATYYDVIAGTVFERAAWSYDHPFGEFEPVAGYVSFYPALLACFVDDERVQPQPGGFYGGWITGELVGPFKGGPGSTGW